MRKFLARVFTLTLVYGPAATAADAEGNYAVWGMGQASCNQYAKAYEQDAIQDYKSYLAGYLTAFNAVAEGVYQATGKNTTADNLKLLYTHCSDNRMHSFEVAVQSLLKKTHPTRQATMKGKVVTWGQSSITQPTQ